MKNFLVLLFLFLFNFNLRSSEQSFSSGINKTYLPWETIQKLYNHLHKINEISNNQLDEDILKVRRQLYSPDGMQTFMSLSFLDNLEKNEKFKTEAKAAKELLQKSAYFTCHSCTAYFY